MQFSIFAQCNFQSSISITLNKEDEFAHSLQDISNNIHQAMEEINYLKYVVVDNKIRELETDLPTRTGSGEGENMSNQFIFFYRQTQSAQQSN